MRSDPLPGTNARIHKDGTEGGGTAQRRRAEEQRCVGLRGDVLDETALWAEKLVRPRDVRLPPPRRLDRLNQLSQKKNVPPSGCLPWLIVQDFGHSSTE
jgi:hypothetical protein